MTDARIENNNQLTLKWNQNRSFLSSGLAKLLIEDVNFSDVTLGCEGEDRTVRAHRNVLAVCSPVFKQFFIENPDINPDEPIQIERLSQFETLNNIIKFIYNGEVDVNMGDLLSFLNAANHLQIEGIVNSKQDSGEHDASLDTAPPGGNLNEPSSSSSATAPTGQAGPSNNETKISGSPPQPLQNHDADPEPDAIFADPNITVKLEPVVYPMSQPEVMEEPEPTRPSVQPKAPAPVPVVRKSARIQKRKKAAAGRAKRSPSTQSVPRFLDGRYFEFVAIRHLVQRGKKVPQGVNATCVKCNHVLKGKLQYVHCFESHIKHVHPEDLDKFMKYVNNTN